VRARCYFYVKNAHRGVIPNLQEFIEEYMSDDALAPAATCPSAAWCR
jgi:hypothetical protein